MRKLYTGLLALMLAFAAVTASTERAEARRGGWIAAGIAAAVIGGIILHRHHRRYRHRHYGYGYPYYAGSYGYYPRYRYRHHRRHYGWRPYRYYGYRSSWGGSRW